MPAPVQARAYATVRKAIDATAELIVEHGEDAVRIQDVVERSGVSAGSLTHHFGSRDGLIAAGLMKVLDAAAQQRARSFELDDVDPERFAAGLRALVVNSAAGERDAARIARLRALAAARRRPELRAAVIESVAGLEELMARRVAASPSGLAADSEVSPLALVVFAESYSAGRIVDTLFGDALPLEDWGVLFARLVRAFVAGDVVDAAMGGATLSSVTEGTAVVPGANPAIAPEDRPALPELDLSADERHAVEVAIDLATVQGAAAVRVQTLVGLTGLSRSWFARHFGEREEILDHVHLGNLLAFSERECRLIESSFDEAVDGEDLGRRLSEVVATMSQPAALDGAWARLQLIAAASGRPVLADQAAPVVHAVLARMAAAIAGAQARGLVHADVPVRALARFLWAAPLAFVLGEVVGVEWRELHQIGQRSAGTLITSSAAPGTED
jgi:AcrR family transcriptional regulator